MEATQTIPVGAWFMASRTGKTVQEILALEEKSGAVRGGSPLPEPIREYRDLRSKAAMALQTLRRARRDRQETAGRYRGALVNMFKYKLYQSRERTLPPDFMAGRSLRWAATRTAYIYAWEHAHGSPHPDKAVLSSAMERVERLRNARAERATQRRQDGSDYWKSRHQSLVTAWLRTGWRYYSEDQRTLYARTCRSLRVSATRAHYLIALCQRSEVPDAQREELNAWYAETDRISKVRQERAERRQAAELEASRDVSEARRAYQALRGQGSWNLGHACYWVRSRIQFPGLDSASMGETLRLALCRDNWRVALRARPAGRNWPTAIVDGPETTAYIASLPTAERRRVARCLPAFARGTYAVRRLRLRRPLGVASPVASRQTYNDEWGATKTTANYHGSSAPWREHPPAASARLAGVEMECCYRDDKSLQVWGEWLVEADSSLHPKDGETSAEVITPPLPWAILYERVARFLAENQRNHIAGGTSRVCGLHVTVGGDPEALLRLFRWLYRSLPNWSGFSGRDTEASLNYAHPNRDGHFSAVNARTGKLAEIRAFVGSWRSHNVDKSLDRIRLCRYVAALTKNGWTEPDDTAAWLDNPPVLRGLSAERDAFLRILALGRSE